MLIFFSEAAVRKYSAKKVFLKILENWQKNTCVSVSFWQSCWPQPFEVQVIQIIKPYHNAAMVFSGIANVLDWEATMNLNILLLNFWSHYIFRICCRLNVNSEKVIKSQKYLKTILLIDIFSELLWLLVTISDYSKYRRLYGSKKLRTTL